MSTCNQPKNGVAALILSHEPPGIVTVDITLKVGEKFHWHFESWSRRVENLGEDFTTKKCHETIQRSLDLNVMQDHRVSNLGQPL